MPTNIKQCIEDYLKKREPDERFASFDYCYNYFYSFKDKLAELANDENMQMSCLQIGFFLASFGMMAHGAFILGENVSYYKKLIRVISKTNPELWRIDVDNYDRENHIDLLIKCKEEIIDALGRENARTWDTLVTKIMLGVFANVPAYDRYFKKFLQKQGYCQTFNKDSLKHLQEFYKENKDIFDSYKIKTLDFQPGKKTDTEYTKAKLIDMCGFMDGQTNL